MLLKRLAIENLRSYEKQEITFPQGSTLLSGDIGSGKTTILLAIEFALFGLQPGQKGTSLLRTKEDNGRVILEAEINGKEVIIERTLKRGTESVSQDYAAITIDNDKYEGSVTEVKSKILKILNYPAEFAKKTNLLYKFTVYTPQEEMKQIILEPGDLRLNTLRHVFGIDKYKRIQENAAILTSKLREKIRINEGMIYDLEDHKELVLQKQEHLALCRNKQKESISEFQGIVEEKEKKEEAIKQVQEKLDEKKALENEKSKSNILISEKIQQINSLMNNIETLRLQVDEAKKISFNEEEYAALDNRITFQQNKEEELQKEYIQIISKINSKESRKRETESLKNKISLMEKCPTCLQEVSSGYKKNIFNKTDEEITELQRTINELSARKNHLIEQIELTKRSKEEFKKRKADLELLRIKQENLKEKEQRIIETENQKQKIEKDLAMLKKHVRSLEKSIEEYARYDREYEQKNRELQEIKTQENQSVVKKAEINKEIQFLEQQIKEKESEIKKKQEIKNKTEKIRETEYWISEKFLKLVLSTEKQVMLTLKEEFSRLFSKWFAMLVSEALTAKLDDNFSPVIEHQDYELDYQFLSGGERTAVALAYRLALNQVINSMLSNIKTNDLVILDEPTDGFSAQQLDKMRDVLNQLDVAQLILVSHEQKIEGFVDNIIRLRKEYGVTGIEE
jgi:exonuclease SbcC